MTITALRSHSPLNLAVIEIYWLLHAHILNRFSIVPIINWLKYKYIYCRLRSDCVFGRPGQSKGWSFNTVISVSNETWMWWFGQWVDFSSDSSFRMRRFCCQPGLLITWWQCRGVHHPLWDPVFHCIET